MVTAADTETLTAELVQQGLPVARAQPLATGLVARRTAGGDAGTPEAIWRWVSQTGLSPTDPLAVHHHVHAWVFAGWDPAHGPVPAYVPDPTAAAHTNLAALMKATGNADYSDLHAWSVRERAAFWSAALKQLGVVFATPATSILDASAGPRAPRWLPGARLNIAASCFFADESATAIISDAPGGGLARITYGQLRADVVRVAAALRAAGFRAGDALAIDMPMTPTAVTIYLAIVWAGMRVVSVADSLAAPEVATRLRIANATGLFTAHTINRGGKRLPLYEKLITAPMPRAIVLDAAGATLREGDLTWATFLGGATGTSSKNQPVIGTPTTVTNVLFSSGTTGEPKAIPWTQLTPIKAATDAAYHFDVKPGAVVAWPTNLGWMMGPWLIYASLLNRATMALYSDAPTGAGFTNFVGAAGVTVLGLVPSIVKAWRADPRLEHLDLSSVTCFGSTGEASNPDDYFYLMSRSRYRPVIEYCGGTEIGGGYLTGTLVQPAAPATFSTPALGSDLVILDEAGQPTDNGEVFLVPPVLGYSETLLNRDHDEVYFDGTPPGPNGAPLRRHGDQIERLPGGYFRAHGRVDDTMNLGGIKVSSAEIERVLDLVPHVGRTAAIAINPPGGGPSELVVYAVVKPGAPPVDVLLPALQQALKAELNPLFKISDLVLVDVLPVTASNKIMRRELRAGYRRQS
jgi:acetyl-CoA synthetase